MISTSMTALRSTKLVLLQYTTLLPRKQGSVHKASVYVSVGV